MTSPSNTDTSGAHEFFFIFDLPYGPTPDPALHVDVAATTLPIMWWGTPRRSSMSTYFLGTEELTIIGRKGIAADHMWTFRPSINQIIPPTYALQQNYPNPFNPNTMIEYELLFESHATLRIYNVLGQLVRTLIDEVQSERYWSVQWDETDNRGIRMASGIYFYRLEATSTTVPGQATVQVKKMALVR